MNVLDYMNNHILYLDGAMGTELQKRGLNTGEEMEKASILHPELLIDIHKEYYDAGSNVVCTNTFGANILKYNDQELEEIIKTAIECAREAGKQSNNNNEKFVALDIGPLGKLLKPWGELDFEDAVDIFAKTIEIGDKYGVDILFIETMNDSYETKAALLAAKEHSILPVFVSNAYDVSGKLMTGATPEVMISMLEGMGADAIGTNCSCGPKELVNVVKTLIERASVPVIVKPNAGLPKEKDGKTYYDIDAEEFGTLVSEFVSQGASAVGGCCGTSPKYISSLYEKSYSIKKKEISYKNYSTISSYAKSVDIGNDFVLIGERINPTGKKKFKEALRNKDINYILSEGIKQEEKGAHVLDVNVGLPDIDEVEMLTNTVFELQSITALPLQLDTSNPEAMEKALRIYNGKPLVNSVNGKEESMEAIFPLVKKYGGVCVALTLDESGIPDTAEGRVEIAKKIINKAKEYGIEKKDLLFDTLAMAVSADSKSAKVTLKAVEMLTEMGCNTSLGVSNISFGLPSRDAVNTSFFTLAMNCGLKAAIMNVYSDSMMGSYYAYKALNDKDEGFREYTKFFSEKQELAPKAVQDDVTDLEKAIVNGMAEKAGELASELLNTCEPLSIINEKIIPALDTVGRGFENKTVFLPGLLMSAEAAKKAFEKVSAAFASQDREKKCKVVIATVKGDIHDIGKNIVRLLLESYGFEVIDLGRDVDPETILKTVKETGAPLVGLSALMTTTVPAMEETIQLLNENVPECKVVVGGAVMTQSYADKIGADKYSPDAMDTVRYADEINLRLK